MYARNQVYIFHQSNAMPVTWLDDLTEKSEQLLFTESLGQVAVLYVPIPRCSRLSALNLNLAECDNFNLRDLRGKYGINILVQMASLKGEGLEESWYWSLKCQVLSESMLMITLPQNSEFYSDAGNI